MNYFHPASGKHIAPGHPFSLNGRQYPANWLTIATPADIIGSGLVEVVEIGQRGDERYYDNAEVMIGGEIIVTATPKPIASIRADLAEQIAASRYALETGGITVGGMAIRTDRESQSMIASALQIVNRNPAAVIDWKGPSGWAQIDKAAVEAVADAVGAHVQACFSAERLRQEALADIDDIDQLIAFDPQVIRS